MDWPIHDGLVLIKQKRYFLFFYLLVSILLSCVGIFLFLDSIFSWNSLIKISRFHSFARIFFALLIMLITVLKSLILIRDIFSPKVVFAYDNDGFYLKNGEFFIPWSDVSDVVIKDKKCPNHKYKQNVIALKFNNEPTFVKVLPVFSRLVYFIRKKIYNYGVWIYFKATDVNPTDVFSLFEKRCPQASVKLENF